MYTYWYEFILVHFRQLLQMLVGKIREVVLMYQ